MLSDPLGPLCIRWRDAPALIPWLARFALASRPAQVERGTNALAALMRLVPAAWDDEVKGSNLAGLFRAKGALVVFHSDAAFGSRSFSGGSNVFVTRLHVRYDANSFPEDLVLQETKDRSNFQGR